MMSLMLLLMMIASHYITLYLRCRHWSLLRLLPHYLRHCHYAAIIYYAISYFHLLSLIFISLFIAAYALFISSRFHGHCHYIDCWYIYAYLLIMIILFIYAEAAIIYIIFAISHIIIALWLILLMPLHYYIIIYIILFWAPHAIADIVYYAMLTLRYWDYAITPLCFHYLRCLIRPYFAIFIDCWDMTAMLIYYCHWADYCHLPLRLRCHHCWLFAIITLTLFISLICRHLRHWLILYIYCHD